MSYIRNGLDLFGFWSAKPDWIRSRSLASGLDTTGLVFISVNTSGDYNYVCLIAAALVAEHSVSGPIDDLIIALLEELRDLLPEPLTFPDLVIDVDSSGVM